MPLGVGEKRCPCPPCVLHAVVLLHLVCSVSSDVSVDIVCAMQLPAFPLSAYDIMLQRISGVGLSAPTSLRSDLITGASAREMHFPDSFVILRFQLLHVTRVSSHLGGTDPTLVVQTLRAKLPGAIASDRIGICGIDAVADASAPKIGGGGGEEPKSWLSGLPDSLAIVALIGWFLTLLFCGGIWIYYTCYTIDTPSADVVVGAPNQQPVAVTPSAPADPAKVSAISNDPPMPVQQPVSRMDSEMNVPRIKRNCASIEFQHKAGARFVDMRLPSLENMPLLKQSSGRTSC